MAVKPADDSKKRALFGEYLASQRIFVVDTSSASRARLAKTLCDLGAKMHQINLYSDFPTAEAALPQINPKVLVTDYYLGGRSGFDLIEMQKKLQKGEKDNLSILVTANSTQSTVARAAEEDVDTFILKPYTIDSFTATLINASMAKLFPSQYIKLINEGKELLVAANPDAAMQLFEKAKELDPKPTLACFYLGQAEAMKKAMEEARGEYQEGLSHNSIHFKCLVGLFDLLMERGELKEAYNIVKRIAQYFPANPKRLSTVLRLAVTTHNFEDIENYYKIFVDLDERSDELVRHICSALIVTGKHFLMRQAEQQALASFEKAAVSAAGRTAYFRWIIENLLDYGLVKQAEEQLKRFPADTQEQPDFLASKFLVSDRQVVPTLSVTLGREVLNKGVQNVRVHLALIKRLIECKIFEQAEALIQEGLAFWPEKEVEFKSLSQLLEQKAAEKRAAEARAEAAKT